jgi:hypothetical protein
MIIEAISAGAISQCRIDVHCSSIANILFMRRARFAEHMAVIGSGRSQTHLCLLEIDAEIAALAAPWLLRSPARAARRARPRWTVMGQMI